MDRFVGLRVYIGCSGFGSFQRWYGKTSYSPSVVYVQLLETSFLELPLGSNLKRFSILFHSLSTVLPVGFFIPSVSSMIEYYHVGHLPGPSQEPRRDCTACLPAFTNPKP